MSRVRSCLTLAKSSTERDPSLFLRQSAAKHSMGVDHQVTMEGSVLSSEVTRLVFGSSRRKGIRAEESQYLTVPLPFPPGGL